jgi:hypothetical protein
MDPNAIPPHIRRIMQDKRMSYAQKMVAFFAFMPNLPPSGNEAVLQENIQIGKKIKELLEEGKIELKVDKNFNMSAVEK